MNVTRTEMNNKIDPYYYYLKHTKQENDEVSFFIKSTHPLVQEEIEKLKAEGCSRVSAIVNNISTAAAKLGSIPKIAALDFVSYLEMARQMRMN